MLNLKNFRFFAPTFAICSLIAPHAIAQQLPQNAIPVQQIPRIRDMTGTDFAREAAPNMENIFGKSKRDANGRAGAPVVQVRRNYVYVEDADGTLTIPPQSNQDLNEWFDLAIGEVYRVLPDEFKFIYLFTSFDTRVGAFFYSPIQNDDSGIGQPRFDQSPNSPLEGFVFMNYWQSFQEQFGQFGPDVVRGFSRSVFNQEAGHRWGTSMDFGPGVGDGFVNQMLGRDAAHWSFFMETGGSPMEGNAWRDNGNGTFTTITDVRDYNYSDLDLYMMGLLGLDQVQPWYVISNPETANCQDIYGQRCAIDSPPQIFNAVTIRGTRTNITIQEVAQRLGQRFPPAGQAPSEFRSVFVLLAGNNSAFSEAQKVQFETMVDGYAQGFQIGTRQLGRLNYVLQEGPPLQPIGGVCTSADQCNPLESTLCGFSSNNTLQFCTRGCSSPASCPQDWCCGPDGMSGTNVCQPQGMCMVPMPDAGVIDTGVDPNNPDAGENSSDGGGNNNGGECSCDLTFSCDENCPCDPECTTRPAGCGCTSANSDVDPIHGLLAFGVLGALIVLRRKGRRS